MEGLRKKFGQNKIWLFYAMLATFIWGLAAHMYGFMGNSFSHDSLKELHGAIFGSDWKIKLGRIFVPLYRDLIRSDATLPWLIGLVSLIWIGLAVFLTIRIFHIESKLLIFLTAGIFTTNISVSATAATYLHDLDCYMFSLLCAIAAVYLWDRFSWGFLPGAAVLAVSMGMYQSYIAVTIVLVLVSCVLDLLNEKSFRYVFRRGLKAIGMLLLGGILYFISVKGMLWLTHYSLATGRNNSMDVMKNLTPRLFLEMTIGAYQDCFARLWNAQSAYPAVLVRGATLLLTAVSVIAVITGLLNKKIGVPEKLLCLVLVALLPLGMNLIYVLTIGDIHDLMVFAVWLYYFLALLLGDWLVQRWKKSGCPPVRIKTGQLLNGGCLLTVLLLMYGNVQFANGMYLKKDLEYDAYLSLMTRVVYRMEDFEEYVPGETQVYFSGLPKNLNKSIPGFHEYQMVTGMGQTDVLCAPQRIRFQAYFDYILCTPINLVPDALWLEMEDNAQIAEMPCYPADGCMEMFDNILVVKLG